MKRFTKLLTLLCLGILLLAACNFPTGQLEEENLPAPVMVTEVATNTPEPTQTPTHTSTSTLTPTPTVTPTQLWLWNEAGYAAVPILLYHHISDEGPFSRYYVSPDAFETQMRSLWNWGYTTISMSLLLDALIEGAELPPKPIVITFDDGNYSVYENAFPILQEFGFTGVNYIVATRLEAEKFLGVDELQEMLAAGWEVGSHGMTHSDLTLDHGSARYEILESRLTLEENLGVEIETLAFPFGAVDVYVAQRTSDFGYRAGIGLGTSWEHSWNTRFYLSRIEIYGSTDLEAFAQILPWSEPLIAGN